MVTRLSSPFAAIRTYGVRVPLAVGWDILTLPAQILNTLTGFPPIAIPNFGQVPSPPSALGELFKPAAFTFTTQGGIPTNSLKKR